MELILKHAEERNWMDSKEIANKILTPNVPRSEITDWPKQWLLLRFVKVSHMNVRNHDVLAKMRHGNKQQHKRTLQTSMIIRYRPLRMLQKGALRICWTRNDSSRYPVCTFQCLVSYDGFASWSSWSPYSHEKPTELLEFWYAWLLRLMLKPSSFMVQKEEPDGDDTPGPKPFTSAYASWAWRCALSLLQELVQKFTGQAEGKSTLIEASLSTLQSYGCSRNTNGSVVLVFHSCRCYKT